MKKSLTGFVAILIGTVSLSQNARADLYVSVISSMVSMGFTDSKTVKHNVGVYSAIVSSVEEKLQKAGDDKIGKMQFSISQIDDLKSRLDKQMGSVSVISYALAPTLESALSEARTAAQDGDIALVLKKTTEAKQKLNEINNSI